ncbi:MAG: XdhC family protein [Paracoccaceae bacterium]
MTDQRLASHQTIPETALAWARSGRGAALATVIDTWGSAPRPVGSQLAISGEGEIAGSVSGGCVEGAVVAEAVEAIGDGKGRLMRFGVSDDDAFAVGLACGGEIRVLLEPVGTALPERVLSAVVEARAARQPVAVATRFSALENSSNDVALAYELSHDLLTYDELPQRFDADRSGHDADAPGRFLTLHSPPLRMAIIGGVHIAQPLSRMARETGYDVTIIDPREAFASPDRFPGETILHDWPDAALRAHGLDIRTAVVLLTHDPKLDDPALIEALGSDAFYIGALGSTRTHAKRRERLEAAGLSPERIARIDAPVGLDIGARSPAEIAVAVLAEMTLRLRRPETRPGRAET